MSLVYNMHIYGEHSVFMCIQCVETSENGTPVKGKRISVENNSRNY